MKKWLLPISLLFSCLLPSSAESRGRFSQLALNFNSERQIDYTTDLNENTITIFFKNTNPDEFQNIDHYDERLIRRVLIKDLASGSELKLYLKDRNVRAVITEHTEPYRVLIDLFDADYKQEVDPQTGLPVAGIGDFNQRPRVDGEPTAGFELLNPSTRIPAETYMPPLELKPNAPPSAPNGRRKLLQPMPQKIHDPSKLSQVIDQATAGRGKHWKQFPYYVYPLQTAAYQGRKNFSGWDKKVDNNTLSDAQRMAEYGLKLFTLGDENRALLAYQQVLHHDPSVFDKDAIHLWAFAEIHLGQGNLILADGYYSALINKHPGSTFRDYAKLRRLDIKSIKSLNEAKTSLWPSIAKSLPELYSETNAELNAQVAIRQAYWQNGDQIKSYTRSYLPRPDLSTQKSLVQNLAKVEGQRTSFLASSLILKHMVNPKTGWSPNIGSFAGEYFNRYKGDNGQPFSPQLSEELKDKLSMALINDSAEKRYGPVVSSYEALPKSLQSIRKTPKVAWAIAQAYRNLGATQKAVPMYERAANGLPDNMGRFKSFMWLALLSSDLENQNRAIENVNNNARGYRAKAVNADRMMSALWNQFSEDEKRQVFAAYKETLEDNAVSPQLLKTPPKIILESWQNGISTSASTSDAKTESEWKQQFSPSGRSVLLLKSLAKKFSKLGMQKERVDTVKLLKRLKPSSFSNDKEAQKIWAEELLSLAEEYRSANQYLEAGRLYTFTAKESIDWDKRAEALYKGGLLLYRSGRRQEAVEALTSASQDGNNLFYANLAKERLVQIQK